jgi:cyclic pyranopterin phosphate synthase
MPEKMTFLPKAEVLSLTQLAYLATRFMHFGVKKIRITGGEPLMRKNVMALFEHLAVHLARGDLQELTLTTNGTRLAAHAAALKACGVQRVNVSLDTVQRQDFSQIARRDVLPHVLDGIAAARQEGLAVKINALALTRLDGTHIDHALQLIKWAAAQGCSVSFIEPMPLGAAGQPHTVAAGNMGQNLGAYYYPLQELQKAIENQWQAAPAQAPDALAGPSRYWHVQGKGLPAPVRVGFITPLSNHFCDSCNRVRLTCTGQLYPCLGQMHRGDLRAALVHAAEQGATVAQRDQAIDAVIAETIAQKPKAHNFHLAYDDRGQPSLAGGVARHMNTTGG